MIFDVYKRFALDIARVDGRWVVYRNSNGTRRPDWTVVVPHDLREDELPGFLDHFFHEYERHGDVITRR